MTQLTLWFTGSDSPALERTEFVHPLLGTARSSIRGKTAGAYQGYATFQWTPAVQAMAILLLRYAATRIPGDAAAPARIQGVGQSPASSLDFAIGKLPHWLLDVFGMDSNGVALARRIFHRTNPDRKRPGPTAVAINYKFMPAEAVRIMVDDRIISTAAEFEAFAVRIESQFGKQRKPAAICEPTPVPVLAPRESACCPCCGGHLAAVSGIRKQAA